MARKKTTRQKIDELTKLCKGAVYIEINPHRSLYMTEIEYVTDSEMDCNGEITEGATLYTIQAYPQTPIGFIIGAGNDLDGLLDWILDGAYNY